MYFDLGFPDSGLHKDKYSNSWEILADNVYQRLIETLRAIHSVEKKRAVY